MWLLKALCFILAVELILIYLLIVTGNTYL